MTDEAPHTPAGRTPETDEVQRRVGRNVLLFQRIEYLLKYLNTHASFKGPASELAAVIETSAQAHHRKTMGELAGRLVDNFLAPTAEEDDPPDDIDEVWLGMRCSIEIDAELLERHKAEMRALVDGRNELVHNFLSRLQPPPEGNVTEALDYLEAQREEGLRLMTRLEGWAYTVEAGLKQWAEYVASPEAQQQHELGFIRSTTLVGILGQIAMQTPRADGWMLLSTAGHIIKRDTPEELQDLRKRFGHSTLKGVLLASELFDVEEEPISGGATRTIYRINSRYELRVEPGE